MGYSLRKPMLEGGLVLCWSSGFIGAVLASEASDVYLVLLWRFVLASILLAPFLIPYLKRSFRPVIALQSLVGAFAMFGYLATGVKAIDVGVPTGTAAMVASLQPLATAALAGVVLQETVTRGQWIGLCLGLLGVSIAVGGGLGFASPWGFGLSFVSMLCIVVATLITKRSILSMPLLPTLGIHCVVSTLLFLIVALTEATAMPEFNIGFWSAVIWLVFFSTIGAYGFYWLCLKQMHATRVASLIYLTPPVVMIWAWLMFDEQIHPSAVVGFIVCFAGVFWARGVSTETQN